jgi:hypothetical protein
MLGQYQLLPAPFWIPLEVPVPLQALYKLVLSSKLEDAIEFCSSPFEMRYMRIAVATVLSELLLNCPSIYLPEGERECDWPPELCLPDNINFAATRVPGWIAGPEDAMSVVVATLRAFYVVFQRRRTRPILRLVTPMPRYSMSQCYCRPIHILPAGAPNGWYFPEAFDSAEHVYYMLRNRVSRPVTADYLLRPETPPLVIVRNHEPEVIEE